MATLPKAKHEVQSYVLADERELPEDQQTKWRVKSLSKADFVTVQDMVEAGKKAASCVFAFARGCLGWENLMSDGAPFLFKGMRYPQDKDRLPRLQPEELDLIPLRWQEEIGGHVLDQSLLSETEKN